MFLSEGSNKAVMMLHPSLWAKFLTGHKVLARGGFRPKCKSKRNVLELKVQVQTLPRVTISSWRLNKMNNFLMLRHFIPLEFTEGRRPWAMTSSLIRMQIQSKLKIDTTRKAIWVWVFKLYSIVCHFHSNWRQLLVINAIKSFQSIENHANEGLEVCR